MQNSQNRANRVNLSLQNLVHFNLLLLIFLPGAVLLIVLMAMAGMARSSYEWLSVNLMSQTAGDYSTDLVGAFTLPPIDPQIIMAVKQDAHMVKTTIPHPDPNEPLPTPIPVTATPVRVTLPPFTVSAGGPYKGDEGQSISLAAHTDSVLRLVPGTIAYQWDLNDDGLYDEAKGRETSVVFPDEGEYQIGLRATDWIGRVATATTTVYVSNLPPLVHISDVGTVYEADKVTFNATASDPGNDILVYEWDFGDGTQSILGTLQPTHIYRDNGDYLVRLRVMDNDDGITDSTLLLQVQNRPPVVNAGPDILAYEGTPVILQGSATDPAGKNDPLTFQWDFDYNGSNFTTDAAGPAASAVYADGPANFVAALLVQDDDGGQTIDTVNVAVNNVNPVITSVTNNGPVGEGSPLTVQVSATDIGEDTLTYDFDWNNDGKFDLQDQPSQIAYTWYNQGDYTVGIRAKDEDGGQTLTTTTVSTFNLPPIAVIGNLGGPLFEGSTVNFSGSDSSDPGKSDVLTYTWHFGDGSSAAAGANVSHVYADNSVYTATLTVADDSGASNVAATLVTILNANPLVQTISDREVNEGVQTTFDATASDPGTADSLTYAWDFTYDGVNFEATAVGPSVHTTYLDGPAVYNVALRVRDDDYPYPTGDGGQIGEQINIFKVTVQNVPPVAEAGGPYTGFETRPVVLSGLATDVPLDTLVYDWDVTNDGNYDLTGQTVNYVWPLPGVYTVTLRVIDDDGGVGLDTARVTIGDAPPIAEANGPYTTTVNLPLTFSAAGSSDPTGDPLTYHWNFGDVSPIIVTTSLTITHTYLNDGPYTATLQVDDGRGGTGTDTAFVTVRNLPPTAVITPSLTSTNEGSPVTFDGGGSSDPGLYDVLTYSWNFGDGSPVVTGITVTHTYLDNGVYPASLTVTDDGGAANTAVVTMTILNVNPTAAANATPNPAAEGTLVTFDGSGSSDPGLSDTLSYQWDFGDGSPTATGQIASHIYADNNTYPVSLTVTDDDGGADTVNFTITISNIPPVINAGGPYTTTVGQPIALTSSATDVPADPLAFAWDLDNNGSFETPGQVVTFTNVASTGVFTVSLRVDDGDGGVTTDTTTVTVASLFLLIGPGLTQVLLRRKRSLPVVKLFASEEFQSGGDDDLTF